MEFFKTRATYAIMLPAGIVTSSLSLALALLAFAAPVHAIPVGSSTISDQGLEWLYPDWSTGISYQDMSVWLIDPESDFYGFRFATGAEVSSLVDFVDLYTWLPQEVREDAEINLDFEQEMQTSAESSAIVKVYMQFSGYIFEDYGLNQTYGISLGEVGYGTEEIPTGSTMAVFFTSPMDDAGWNIGSWLVRDSVSVPEPGTLALLGLGLVGMGMRRRLKAS